MSSESLKIKARKGLFWSSIERFSNQGIQFAFGIVFARILSPSDYGIVAMTTIFFAIAQTFVDSGFSSALVRKKNRTQEDMSTCFWFNVGVGFFFYMILFLSGPMIAKFYNQLMLDSIIKISGLNVVLNSLCIVQQAQFTFSIDFKSQAKITLSASIISGILGIILAYMGYGVWALIWQGVAGATIRMFLLWIMSRWRPDRIFSGNSFRYLFRYGSKLLASGLLDTTYRNIYPIVIGKFYSSAQLGNFTRAEGWASLPSSNITGVLQRVTFPILSEMQDNNERLALNYRKLLRMSAFIVFPLMVGMAAVASPLIRIVITAKWDACVPMLQIICFAMMWYPIHAINLNLLQVKGRSDLFLRLEIIKKIMGVSIMCITIPLGVTAMCVGMVFSSLISLIINTYYTDKLIGVGFWRQMKDLFPILFNSVVMGIIVFLSISYINIEMFKLMAGLLIGIICYVGGARLFTHSDFNECMNVIRR